MNAKMTKIRRDCFMKKQSIEYTFYARQIGVFTRAAAFGLAKLKGFVRIIVALAKGIAPEGAGSVIPAVVPPIHTVFDAGPVAVSRSGGRRRTTCKPPWLRR